MDFPLAIRRYCRLAGRNEAAGRSPGGGDRLRVLRNLGKDTFVLSYDVIACLQDAGLDVDKATSKRELRLIQDTFNHWHQETKLSYCHLSRICACSIGENYHIEQTGDEDD